MRGRSVTNPTDPSANLPAPQSGIILYQTEDGRTRIECRFEHETLWLTEKLIADLFQIGVNTINHHLGEIYADGELDPFATTRQYRIVQKEGPREVARELEHYSLPAILAGCHADSFGSACSAPLPRGTNPRSAARWKRLEVDS